MDNRGGYSEHTDRLLAHLAARQHGVFLRQQAVALAMTPRMIQRRLESGLWVAVYAGVYRLAGAPPSPQQRLLAACLAGGPEAVASHRAAGSLWALDGLEPGRLEITVPGNRRTRLTGVTLHRTRSLRRSVTTVDHIPVTRPWRTLIDLAAVLDELRLEEAVDSALRQGLSSVGHLRRCLERLGSKGRNGTEVLGALLEARDGRRPAESRKELEMARSFVAAGLPWPDLQYELLDGDQVIARFDCAYPALRIGAEYNSYRHHYGRHAWEHDQGRYNRVAAHGWLAFTFTGADLREGPAIESLCRAYARRAAV